MQLTGLNRNITDKFYTKKNIADQCIELVKNNIHISENDLIIEPSAGNGAFINGIKTLSPNYLFYDLEPEHEEIIKLNFLEFNLNVNQTYDKIHIIGNPPFGRQSSLAIQFIKKCCSFANSISFILPKSFKKDSMQKHFSSYFHLVYEEDLPEKSFLINKENIDVPCLFQIWEKHDELRPEIIKKKPYGYKFVEKYNNPDISFRRVGINAGIITREINNKSIQSHYFIKFTNDKSLDENLEILKIIKFQDNNTVGPKSISKQELIKEFNRLLSDQNN